MNFIVDDKVFKGIDKYNYIMQNIQKTDVYANQEFRKKYCAYYGLNRNTSKDFQDEYFKYMQENKSCKTLDYGRVLRDLYEKTNRVDYSFSSKLLHTINPDMPILDKHLMRMLGFQLKSIGDNSSRLDYYKKVYDIVLKEYNDIHTNLSNGNAKIHNAIRVLQETFQNKCQGLSMAKIIDSIIFRMKDARGPSILEI